jgi:hypothetical protein
MCPEAHKWVDKAVSTYKSSLVIASIFQMSTENEHKGLVLEVSK